MNNPNNTDDQFALLVPFVEEMTALIIRHAERVAPTLPPELIIMEAIYLSSMALLRGLGQADGKQTIDAALQKAVKDFRTI